MHYSERMLSSISQDPVVSEKISALQVLGKAAKERMSFIFAQLTSIKKQLQKDSDPIWNDLMCHLKFKGALPQTWRHSDTDYLKFDDKTDAVYAIHDCDCGPCGLRKALDSTLNG